MTLRSNFLILPAYILGLLIACAAGNLLPPVYGLTIASVLVLAMLTPLSLLHPKLDDEWILQAMVYCFTVYVAWHFAYRALPTDIGPHIGKDWGWLQVGFVAVQQALYFGIHAFRRPHAQ